MASTITRTRPSKAVLAGLLLVLQSLAGGAVALAHAAERTTAPAAIEAQHSARCPVLHDVAKCPQCQYAGAHAVVRQLRGLLPAGPVAEPRPWAAGVAIAVAPDHPASRPRPPPSLPS
ncbi:MAG: hypothetical protein ACREL9_11230 [Gemmatimonadales bacterium]